MQPPLFPTICWIVMVLSMHALTTLLFTLHLMRPISSMQTTLRYPIWLTAFRLALAVLARLVTWRAARRLRSILLRYLLILTPYRTHTGMTLSTAIWGLSALWSLHKRKRQPAARGVGKPTKTDSQHIMLGGGLSGDDTNR